jgi:ceramide glucosyltransferase
MAAAIVATACAAAYAAILLGKAILALRYAARYPRSQPQPQLPSSSSSISPASPPAPSPSSPSPSSPSPSTPSPSPGGVDLSAATIVQPILSGDPDLPAALADNLAALPQARFLWMIDDDDAEAAAITLKLRDAHPSHRIERRVCAAAPDGVNPKLFKLEASRSAVTDGAFVVVDDDTRLTREGLAALLGVLDTHTLATGLPCYVERGRDLASRLLAQFVNNNAALTYLPLLAFAGPPTINGMTYAMTPASLDAIGGFAPLWRHLADDLAVARRVIRAGGTICQTPYPQFVATSVRDLRHYRVLMHRWFLFALLLLREQPARWRLAIVLLHGLPPLLLWTMLLAATISVASAGLAPSAMAAASAVSGAAAPMSGMPALPPPALAIIPMLSVMVVLALRAVTLIVVQRRLTGRGRHSPVLSIVSELLQPLHVLHAAVDRRIVWRTRRYAVRANDDFRAV